MRLDSELSSLMDEAMVVRNQGGPGSDPPPSERHLPRVSSFKDGCARQAYYFLAGAEALPMDAMSTAATEAGKAFEDAILDDLETVLSKKYGEKVVGERQVKIVAECFVGTADWWYPKRKILADGKTGNPSKCDIARKQGTPGEGYEVQTNLYADELGAEQIVIPLRAVGKSKKDGPGIHQFWVGEPDKALAAQAKVAARAALAARETGTPPPPAFDKSHWLCKGYCSYRHLCPNGGGA